MMTVESAKKYEDLLGNSVADSPYDYSTLFNPKGFLGRQRAKRSFQIMKRIDLRLRSMLDRSEKVHLITLGTVVTAGERIVVERLSFFLNRRALVFTNRRILMLHVNVFRRPKEMVSQLPYASIASVKPTWNGMCAVKLLNREILTLQHLPNADRESLVEFLSGIVQLTNAPFEQKRGVEDLCPHCFSFVPDHPNACPKCTGRFKSARLAGFLSMVFPGTGSWYLGFRGTSIITLLLTSTLWFFLVAAPLLKVPLPYQPLLMSSYWISVAVALLLVHLAAALTSHHFGRKGHYPSGAAPLPTTLPPSVNRPKPDPNALNRLKISRSTPPTPT